ncbi:MAG: ferrochelatase [Acidimicrobiia bacterium]|jgi:protoporphyrin/coproporphyrin ferrochelatase
MRDSSPVGVLLVQLGTPDSTRVSDVRRYLDEFLSDPRVLDVPAPVRWLLLKAVILPFRPRRSAEAYEKIWTEAGSPLVLNTAELGEAVARLLGDRYRVAVGMRYQQPSIESAVEGLVAAGCEHIVVLPLFPQYSSAATGSAAERALEVIGARWNVPAVSSIGAFYDEPRFVQAVAEVARPLLDEFAADHVLFSYHGLPEKQIEKSDVSGDWCLARPSCCDRIVEANRYCYRAQAFATSRALAAQLGLAEGSYSTSFQSRLAGQRWIRPYTDKVLPKLYESGVRRLAVLTPSFVADCLETLEEIGIRGRDQWTGLGGTGFLLVPCVNHTEPWAAAVADLVRRAG